VPFDEERFFQPAVQQGEATVSYSFSAKGTTKADAIAAVIAKMDEVVVQQPIHAADREPAIETAKAFINLIPDDNEKDFSVSVSGSLGWTGTYPDSHIISNAQVNVYASLVKRDA
jgi:flavorubredoxin